MSKLFSAVIKWDVGTYSKLVFNHLAVQRRYAGHSKWQNIRHTKGLADGEKSKLFARYAKQIKSAVLTGGNPNPDYNSSLQNIIFQAKKASMPQSTIQNAIKGATGMSNVKFKTILFEARGINRSVLLVEVLTDHVSRAKQDVGNIIKKASFKFEANIKNIFKETGIIIAEPLKEVPDALEKAMEHAIECGAEEVQEIEETKQLEFECAPLMFQKVRNQLESFGYHIVQASIEYIPTVYTELDEKDMEKYNKMYEKLESHPECVRIIDNISS